MNILPRRCRYCRRLTLDTKRGKLLDGTPVRFCRNADDCRRRITRRAA